MTARVELLLSYLWLLHCTKCSFQEETPCRSNLSELVLQVAHCSQNWLQLQEHFCPLHQNFPSLGAVHYHYEEDDHINSSYLTEEVWLWASSPFYLYHSPPVHLYTSFFFSDADPNLRQLHLNLSQECRNASDKLMRLLTERVTDTT